MVDWEQFTNANGTRIDFARVAEVGVGTVIGAAFTGIVSVILGLADIPLALLAGLADFGGEVVAVVAGLPAAFIRGSFVEAAAFVLDAGPAGYVVGLGISLATFYVVARVVDRVR